MIKKNMTRSFARYLSQYAAVVALVVFFAYGAIFLPNFLSDINLKAIVSQYSIIGFLAMGQLVVILTGGIDLSQGAMIALSSVIIAIIIKPYGIVLAILAAVIAITLLGAINGLLISRTNMPAFIVTLGMLGIVRGLALFANLSPLPINNDGFNALAKIELLRMPVYFFVWIALCFVVFWFLKRRLIGRYVFAVGSSEESTRLSGVNVKNIKLFVYIFSAFITVLGGIFWTSRVVSGSPTAGNGYEFEAIAAVVVGGGSLFGGKGSVFGTAAAVLLFGVISSILNLTGISPYLQGTIKGALILLAVVLSDIRRTKQEGKINLEETIIN